MVIVGKFDDARSSAEVGTAKPNPMSAITWKFKSNDNVTEIVRNAFVDASLKSGFEVPLSNQQTSNALMSITGKILTYQTKTKAGFSKVSLAADVVVEVTIIPNTGNRITFSVSGNSSIEQKAFLNVENSIPDLLDRALQECVKNFVQDARFRSLVKS